MGLEKKNDNLGYFSEDCTQKKEPQTDNMKQPPNILGFYFKINPSHRGINETLKYF